MGSSWRSPVTFAYVCSFFGRGWRVVLATVNAGRPTDRTNTSFSGAEASFYGGQCDARCHPHPACKYMPLFLSHNPATLFCRYHNLCHHLEIITFRRHTERRINSRNRVRRENLKYTLTEEGESLNTHKSDVRTFLVTAVIRWHGSQKEPILNYAFH